MLLMFSVVATGLQYHYIFPVASSCSFFFINIYWNRKVGFFANLLERGLNRE